MIIFEREYSDESLIDLEQHLMDVIYDDSLNIPQDEYGFRKGVFRVAVSWEEELLKQISELNTQATKLQEIINVKA